MGTRNLTLVKNENGETKIAQYGQWDGYLSGQGKTILEFISTIENRKLLLEKLKIIRFENENDEKELDLFLESIGSIDGWMNLEQGKKYIEKYPLYSRDIGGEILEKVCQSNKFEIVLKNYEDFLNDELFCEYAYCVDFQKNKFIIYSGGNNILKEYDLSSLPNVEEFLELEDEN